MDVESACLETVPASMGSIFIFDYSCVFAFGALRSFFHLLKKKQVFLIIVVQEDRYWARF